MTTRSNKKVKNSITYFKYHNLIRWLFSGWWMETGLRESFLNALKPNATGSLVTDLRMPGLLVEEIVKELKCLESNINIIIVSGDDDLVSKKIAKDIGAIGFFRKPVDGTALIDAINWLLKNNKKK